MHLDVQLCRIWRMNSERIFSAHWNMQRPWTAKSTPYFIWLNHHLYSKRTKSLFTEFISWLENRRHWVLLKMIKLIWGKTFFIEFHCKFKLRTVFTPSNLYTLILKKFAVCSWAIGIDRYHWCDWADQYL